MKIDGVKIEGVNEDFIVIPRGDNKIVLRARAITSYSEFDTILPLPKPPTKIKPGGKKVVDIENPRYRQAIEEYSSKRTYWMLLKSLEATESLEWDTVQINDPSTWNNFEKELRDSGFSEIELTKIVQLVLQVNSLDEAKLEKAREDFLLSLEQQREELISQKEEQELMLSGKLVSDLE